MEKKLYIKTIFLITISILLITETTAAFTQKDSTLSTQEEKHKMIIVSKNEENSDYQNINQAIKKARSNTTIYIKEGMYKETININKKINLIGENKKNILINPKSEKNKYAIQITHTGVTLTNLTVINKGPGIYTTGIKIIAPNTKIKDLQLKNTPIGIAIWSSYNKIINTTFLNHTDEGIALIGTTVSPSTHNQITNCQFIKNCDGIEIQRSSHNLIKNCTFKNNTHDGISMILKNNNHNKIKNCTIENNQAHGIYISKNSLQNQITNCHIYQNYQNIQYKNKNQTIEKNNQYQKINKKTSEKTEEIITEGKQSPLIYIKTILDRIKKLFSLVSLT